MSKEQDEISILLDSLNEDDELDRKMNAFAQRKGKQKKLSRAQKEVDLTQIRMEPIKEEEPLVLGLEDKVGATRTMDWNEQKQKKAQPVSGTVVINDDEIKSLLDEEKGPKLRREVVQKKTKAVPIHDEPEVRLKKQKKSQEVNEKESKRTVAVIMVALLGVILAGALIFGVVHVIGNLLGEEEITTELQEKYFNEIMDWAEMYSTYDEDERNEIIGFEKKFNKLTKEQKEEIDNVLIAQTGNSFDELLAKAKSSSKTKKKNDNTKIAEQKAKLKEQIDDLKIKLHKAEDALEEAQDELTTAEGELNEANNELSAAKAAISQAEATYNDAKVLYQKADSRRNELYEKQFTEEGLTEEEQAELGELYANYSTLQANYQQAEANLNDLKSQYNLSSLEKAVSKAQGKVDKASQAVDEAQGKIDSIKQEISKLQNEYDELDDEN